MSRSPSDLPGLPCSHTSFTNSGVNVTLINVTAASVQSREYSPVDITSHGFWRRTCDVRDEAFARLRAGEGLSWHQPLPSTFLFRELLTRLKSVEFGEPDLLYRGFVHGVKRLPARLVDQPRDSVPGR